MATETTTTFPPDVGATLAKLRIGAGLTQSRIAQEIGLDQSRVSRIEKGEIAPVDEIQRILKGLDRLGHIAAQRYGEFVRVPWVALARPTFHNPQLAVLRVADQTLGRIETFLQGGEHPWPLVRQLERQAAAIRAAAAYLQSTEHELGFLGDIGVGKSTAICFLLGLLIPESVGSGGALDRVVLETGGGRVTLCPVHIRRGPDYGFYVQAQTEPELRAGVSDFCASIWVRLKEPENNEDNEQVVQVSEELGRAIRNMARLGTKRERHPDGRRVSRDLAKELAADCRTEAEFRARVLEKMQIDRRTRHELWFNHSSGSHPMRWMAETFKSINNGRLEDVPLPRRIDLLVPDFAVNAAPLEIAVIDTKGVDDLAVRPDLDARLKDPRALIVLCTRFNDAPGTTPRTLLEHMRKNLGERAEEARTIILVLPQGDEARKIKDDSGALAEDDSDGYELKREQLNRSLGGEAGLDGAPILFFNAAKDDPAQIRNDLLERLAAMRGVYATRVQELAETVDDLIENHEAQAVNAALEEVANRLRFFLKANRPLQPHGRKAHQEVTDQLRRVRYGSTVWAATRRNGDWYGFDACYHLGVGAGKEALARSRGWFNKLEGQLGTLRADPGLRLARRLVQQIEKSADGWRRAFAEAARTAGAEVYREKLQQDQKLWMQCAAEWGKGLGFRDRVVERLENWFVGHDELLDVLDQSLTALWTETVLRPLEQMCEEDAAGLNESGRPRGNVVPLRGQAAGGPGPT